MNKRIILFLSIFICTHFINGQKTEIIQCIDSFFKIPASIYEKISKPFFENKFINDNKALKVITWGSLGTLFGYISYRTMYNIYHKKPNPDPHPMLEDKLMLTIICYIFAAENAFGLYKKL